MQTWIWTPYKKVRVKAKSLNPTKKIKVPAIKTKSILISKKGK